MPLGCSVCALGATVGALGITKNPSVGDYAPILPTAGVRQPTRGTAAARRSVAAMLSPSSGGGFELPRHSSGDGSRLVLRRGHYSAAALTPRLLARGGSRASRAGPPPRLLPSGGAPAPSLVPPLPAVGPLLTSGLRGERLRATPAHFFSATRGFLHRGRGLFRLRRRRCGCPPLVEQSENFPLGHNVKTEHDEILPEAKKKKVKAATPLLQSVRVPTITMEKK